MILASGSATKS